MSTKRDLRFFNTTGPCDPDYHYMLPPEERLVSAQLHRYIKDRLYWALDYVYGQSLGQPWIVNSLFKRATMRVLEQESVETVTLAHVQKAREQMIYWEYDGDVTILGC